MSGTSWTCPADTHTESPAFTRRTSLNPSMVKPALPYLDIIAKFRAEADVPVAAYSVSGEYEMVKQLALKGMADERKLVLENLSAIRRAGAQVILTYFASDVGEKGWLK